MYKSYQKPSAATKERQTTRRRADDGPLVNNLMVGSREAPVSSTVYTPESQARVRLSATFNPKGTAAPSSYQPPSYEPSQSGVVPAPGGHKRG